MSTYSSVFRSSMWGGLPIALWSLAVFAYLFFRSLEFALRPQINKRETLFLLAAWGLPVVMSIGYGLVAVSQLGSVCKLCVGIYFSSALGFGLSVWLHRQAKPQPRHTTARIFYWRWFGEGVGFVALLTIVYLVLAPTNPKSLSGCGTLAKKQDPAKILLPTSSSTKGPSAARGVFGVAVMDPLCGACRGFHNRLTGSGLLEQVDLHTMLMPLDSACNWMVKDSLHPGACQVSEAILCDPKNAQAIMDYAFLHQDALLELGKTDRKQLAKRLATAFPQVRSCLGTPHIRNKLNKSLRWAVANALPVLTPQLFIGERRVCDEDTDLGLEYTVAQMLQRATTKGRR